jgi:hypothetical protein
MNATANNVVVVKSPFGGDITIRLDSATSGYAIGTNLRINNIDHSELKMYFKVQTQYDNFGTPRNYVGGDYRQGVFLSRDGGGFDDATPNAKGKVLNIVCVEAEKLMLKPDMAAEGNRAESLIYLQRRNAPRIVLRMICSWQLSE